MCNNLENLCAYLRVLDTKWITVRAAFDDSNWLNEIDNVPGWYSIESNVDRATLDGLPDPTDTKHYNLRKRAQDSRSLEGVINIASGCVYSGEARKLRDRIRSHFREPKGTGCLALSQYKPLIRFDWSVRYARYCEVFFDHSNIRANSSIGQTRMTVIEQAWRFYNGWPVFCVR